MKKKIMIVPVLLLFLSGMSLLMYPFAANEWNNYRQRRLITDYENTVAQIESEEQNREWERAERFNESIQRNELYGEGDSGRRSTDLTDKEYLAVLNAADNGIMGYLSIPKIDTCLAIYHGTGEEILQTGIGHLSGTKLPIGGKSTHSVLVAHRGLPSARLFTDIDQLEYGDYFYIHILGNVLAYKTDQILPMIDKDDRKTLEEALQIMDGKDQVTLFTCTPYGVNSHRLLVRGTRVSYEGEEKASAQTDTTLKPDWNHDTGYLILGLLITVIAILIIRFLTRLQSSRI